MQLTVIPPDETGHIPLKHLKRFWHKNMLKRTGQLKQDAFEDEWQLDKALLAALGLGIEPTLIYLFRQGPSFEEFEKWVIQTAGQPSAETIEHFNKSINAPDIRNSASVPKVLSEEQMAFWEDNGYLVLKNAISKEDCENTIDTICRFISIKRDDPLTWYNPHHDRQGIMVQLFQNEILEKNRRSEIILAAYQQLYNRMDIWINTDRVGFNPPETATWKFPGPRLHWDTKLDLPIPYSLQGLLYLADTEANQGAFCLVPGFHRRIDSWLGSLPKGGNPYHENLYDLGCIPIAGNAGDFIIWHQALPHGSSPNTSTKPRFVQYFTYEPLLLD